MKISSPKVVLSVILMVVGIFLLCGGWEAFLDYARTRDYVGIATGQVVKKHFVRAPDGNTFYHIDYLFTSIGGEKIQATVTISKQLWDVLKEEDRLNVRYNPEDPRRSFLAESGGASLIFVIFIFLLGFVFSFFSIATFIRGLKKRRKRK